MTDSSDSFVFPTPPANIVAKLDELNGWRNQRQQEYGNLGYQLNLLWDDIDNGLFGDSAKNGQWYVHVKGVKDSIVKPDVDTIQAEVDSLIAAEDSV